MEHIDIHRGSFQILREKPPVDKRFDDASGLYGRIKLLRTFLRWLQQFEPRTEIPDDSVFGRMPERLSPHIYSDQEIIDLLVAARRLGPAPGLRGAIYETLFGLIASTGMRVGEALALRNEDVDLKYGMLTIHQTKFGKSRQVPMHPSTVEALRRYLWIRNLAGDFAPDGSPFFIATRGQRLGLSMDSHQVHRVFASLREQLGWRNRGAHHAPRIHDLRHTFVVRRIVLWQAEGVDTVCATTSPFDLLPKVEPPPLTPTPPAHF